LPGCPSRDSLDLLPERLEMALYSEIEPFEKVVTTVNQLEAIVVTH
jgi:hypothetical protein